MMTEARGGVKQEQPKLKGSGTAPLASPYVASIVPDGMYVCIEVGM